MINEMLALAVLPLFRMDRERFLAEWVGIALAELGKLHLGQRIQAGSRRRLLGKGELSGDDRKQE